MKIKLLNFACFFVWVGNLVVHTEGERMQRVCENRILRRIFVSKRNDITRSGEN